MAKIIGRESELAEFQRIYDSGKAEFVVVYGRRRVGKTFLIREYFKQKFAFYHTALSPIELEGKNLCNKQLQSFHSSLMRYGAESGSQPQDWFEAFDMLISLLKQQKEGKRQVVFIDEMPWMDTPRSGFITALEHFWNGWAAGKENIMLIVCGSSTSWITDNLINNHGGLYGRTTREIKLQPFSLYECEQFYESKNISFSRQSQAEAYMILGGIPYYIDCMEKELSLAQNIDKILFRKNGKLANEFDRLFTSLFTNASDYKKIVTLLSQRREGFSRKEISDQTGIPYGGGLSNMLRVLEVSDFILPYTYWGESSRNVRYKLIDPFCLFHCYFKSKKTTTNESFWQDNLTSPTLNVWRGLAFEDLCFSHTQQIKKALGISGVHTEISPWRSRTSEGNNAQIDMLIARADRTINVCEMKFVDSEFVVDKDYETKLRNKLSVFQTESKTKSSLHLTLITTYGLIRNSHSDKIQNVVVLDDLFTR